MEAGEEEEGQGQVTRTGGKRGYCRADEGGMGESEGIWWMKGERAMMIRK